MRINVIDSTVNLRLSKEDIEALEEFGVISCTSQVGNPVCPNAHCRYDIICCSDIKENRLDIYDSALIVNLCDTDRTLLLQSGGNAVWLWRDAKSKNGESKRVMVFIQADERGARLSKDVPLTLNTAAYGGRDFETA